MLLIVSVKIALLWTLAYLQTSSYFAAQHTQSSGYLMRESASRGGMIGLQLIRLTAILVFNDSIHALQ